MAREGITRRAWLGGAAALAMPGVAGARRIGANDRVNLAVIGAGGMGAQNMTRLTGQNIVAAADVDFPSFVNDEPVVISVPVQTGLTATRILIFVIGLLVAVVVLPLSGENRVHEIRCPPLRLLLR